VEKIITKSNDNFIEEILDDVNDLMDDLEPYMGDTRSRRRDETAKA